jgi:hypothetical protein
MRRGMNGLADALFQGSLDLNPYWIGFIAQSWTSVARAQPVPSNDRDQNVASQPGFMSLFSTLRHS